MTVNELIAELQAHAADGNGEAPIWVRRQVGVDPEDEPATITCVLPYVERDTPTRVLID